MLGQGLSLLSGICKYWPLYVHTVRIAFYQLSWVKYPRVVSVNLPKWGLAENFSVAPRDDPIRTRRKVLIYSHLSRSG